MTDERCLIDAAQFQRFQKLVAASVVLPEGDQLSVNRYRLQEAITQGLAFINPTWWLDNELMDALNRLYVATTIEVVCLRRDANNDGIEVLLTKHWDFEPNFPALWCCPRTTKQPGESDGQALDRIGQALATTLSNRKGLGSSGESVTPHHRRRFYRCEVADGTKGTWFPVRDLPAMDMTRRDVEVRILSEATA